MTRFFRCLNKSNRVCCFILSFDAVELVAIWLSWGFAVSKAELLDRARLWFWTADRSVSLRFSLNVMIKFCVDGDKINDVWFIRLTGFGLRIKAVVQLCSAVWLVWILFEGGCCVWVILFILFKVTLVVFLVAVGFAVLTFFLLAVCWAETFCWSFYLFISKLFISSLSFFFFYSFNSLICWFSFYFNLRWYL